MGSASSRGFQSDSDVSIVSEGDQATAHLYDSRIHTVVAADGRTQQISADLEEPVVLDTWNISARSWRKS